MAAIYAGIPVNATDKIRLLQIIGITQDGLLETTLEVVSLHKRPHYNSLSYTWTNPLGLRHAPPEAPKTIICNGVQVDILSNLLDALIVLAQSQYKNDYFWIDAICIDQAGSVDADEKAGQLLLMPSIYKYADTVIIFLGPSDEDTLPALALIKTIGTLSKHSRAGIKPSKLDVNLLGESGIQSSSWRSVARLFCRSWFWRAWVVQEALNASTLTVMCGEHELSWTHVVKMSDLLATTEWATLFSQESFYGNDRNKPNHKGPAKLRATRFQKFGGEEVLLYSLIRARGYQCFDPRDKIFSLLPSSDVINYGLSVEEVYTKAAKHMLQQSDDLLLLAHAEGTDYIKFQDTVPSWVPDWSVPQTLGLGITGYTRYSASGDSPRFLHILETSLQIKGEFLTSITRIGRSKKDSAFNETTLDWLQMVDSVKDSYSLRESLLEALCRVLIADTGPEHPASPEVVDSFNHWLVQRLQTTAEQYHGLISRLDGTQTSALPAVLDSSKADHYGSYYSHSMCQRPFVTDTSLIGLGTTSLREGDRIYVVYGSRVPLIFRPTTVPDTYTLVGGCYLRGAMLGEMLNKTPARTLIIV